MNVFFENDVVRLQKSVKADVIGGGEVFISEGTVGTVVVVYGGYDHPKAYEVEFFILEHNEFALATVDAEAVIKV